MHNITYTIKDKTDDDNDDNDEKLNKRLKYNHNQFDQDKIIAMETDYELNYSLPYLTYILEYYGQKKQKMNKKEIIKKIVDVESNPINKEMIEERVRLFNNLIELKNNTYFKKYIIGFNLFN